MANETPIEQVEESVQDVVVEPVEEVADETKVEISEETPNVPEETEGVNTDNTDDKDLVAEAMETNKRMKAELEELKAKNTNVFEENAILQNELEKAKELQKLAEENSKLKLQLDDIKRSALVENMLATGQLNDGLTEWAKSLSIEQLQTYSKSAPKQRTIFDEKNPSDAVTEDENLKEWHKKVSQPRIIS